MSGSLNGRKVLVTRPREQGADLCRLIEADGGVAIAFPTLELTSTDEPGREQLMAFIAAATHIIFVSRNAVRFAGRLAGDLAASLKGKTVCAVGGGTRRELAVHAVNDVISPGAEAGSEQLLELPAFAVNAIRGRHMLIVRGEGGRELLARQLQDRGAGVQYADVYRRSEPAGSREKIGEIWRSIRPDVIVATSEQGLRNLIRMTADKDSAIMFDGRLVVISTRLAEVAREAGFVRPAYVAVEQSDPGLLDAIRKSVE